MKWIILIMLFNQIASATIIGGFEYSDKEISEIKEGLREWKNIAENAKKNPSADLIPQLGLGLRKTSLTSIYVVGDRLGVHKELQEALLSIPGHAEYYANQINAAWQVVEEGISKNGEAGDGTKGVLHNAQMYGFQTLSQLPSAETVRVLGEFLTDNRGKFTPPPGASADEISWLRLNWHDSANSDRAAITLTALPLTTRPYPKRELFVPGDVERWLLWYNQVKAGRRTFSFEGDPQEYDLTGPVRGPRNPDIARTSKRSGFSETPGDSQLVSLQSNTPWIASIVAALLGFGGYLYLRKKRAA